MAPPTAWLRALKLTRISNSDSLYGGTMVRSGRNTTGVPNRPKDNTLHAEHHFEYHRALRPGDVLSAVSRDGNQWENLGRSGQLHFKERITDYFDTSGVLVVSAAQ